MKELCLVKEEFAQSQGFDDWGDLMANALLGFRDDSIDKVAIEYASQFMHWLPIDPDNLPEGEVLAARFGDGFNFKHLGYLSLNQRCIIMCIKNNSILTGCTHYIDINKFDL
jgi:hypothetical protein